MLNKDLNWSSVRQRFAESGYVRIENALDPKYATLIANEIIHATEWNLCYLTNNGPHSITHEELKNYPPENSIALNRDIISKARTGFSYYYYRADLVESTNAELEKFFNYLRGNEFLGFSKYLTDELSINNVNGQLTCYRPGCFLRRHNDTTNKEHRIAAYVFGFTPLWEADWGGLLHIQDDAFNIIDTHIPAFNTLTIFRVPTWHFVTQVASYAQGLRYTATGWILAP